MGINVDDLNKLSGELKPFADALKEGKQIEVYVDEREGWCLTGQIHTYKSAKDYRVV